MIPMPTIGYSEARTKWPEITSRVIDGDTITVIKNNKPAFVLVPIDEYIKAERSSRPRTLLDISEEVDAEYGDVLDRLA